MPQLDIYTYFTQFHWLLLIITFIFFLINGQFIPTFQSLFEVRNYFSISDTIQSKSLKFFESGNKSILTKIYTNTPSAPLSSKWDSIFDLHNRRNKSNVSKNSRS